MAPLDLSVEPHMARRARFEGLLAIPLLSLGIYLLMLLVPRFDPGRANYQQFATPYTTLRLGILAVLWVLYGVIHLCIRGYEANVATIVPLDIGLFFVVMGGLLGKIRPNWFVGIRTPWTLSSKLAWTRTHRLAGWLFLLTGVTFILAGLLPSPWTAGAAFVVGIGSAVWMVTYSYLVWRTDPDKTPPAGTLPAWERRDT